VVYLVENFATGKQVNKIIIKLSELYVTQSQSKTNTQTYIFLMKQTEQDRYIDFLFYVQKILTVERLSKPVYSKGDQITEDEMHVCL
jgi:hypothetical protein